MNKVTIFTVVCAVICVVMTGCNFIYDKYNVTPEEAHNRAVEKVTNYVENYVVKKIEASDKLSDKGKADLKAEVAKIKEDIIKKIGELKAKYDEAKAAKKATETKEEVKTEAKTAGEEKAK